MDVMAYFPDEVFEGFKLQKTAIKLENLISQRKRRISEMTDIHIRFIFGILSVLSRKSPGAFELWGIPETGICFRGKVKILKSIDELKNIKMFVNGFEGKTLILK